MKKIVSVFMALIIAAFCVVPSFAEPGIHDFKDVNKGDWYYNAVRWALRESITNGVSTTRFNPNGECTRAEFVTFLWRDALCPEPKTNSNGSIESFSDVNFGMYYTKAVAWAKQCGIVEGIKCKDGRLIFDPNKPVNRAEAATMIWRALGRRTDMGSTVSYVDVPWSGTWYSTAIYWLTYKGVLGGFGNGYFAPGNVCTRAQIVKMLYATADQKLGGKNTAEGYIPFPCSP